MEESLWQTYISGRYGNRGQSEIKRSLLYCDNVGNNKLHNREFTDFCKEYPTVNLSMQKTGGIFSCINSNSG